MFWDIEKMPDSKIDLSIIIPIYNLTHALCHATGHCLGNIRSYTKDFNYEVIVLDNKSPIVLSHGENDLSKYVDKLLYAEEELISVARSWNAGAFISRGKYLCFMNNDVMVYDNWAKYMIEDLERCDLVMSTPMYDDPYARREESLKRTESLSGDYLSEKADMSCFMIKKSTFDRIGFFDEKIKLAYGEDLDYRIRIEEAGGKCRSDKRVNTFHIIGATSHEIIMRDMVDFYDIQNKNKEYVMRKHGKTN